MLGTECFKLVFKVWGPRRNIILSIQSINNSFFTTAALINQGPRRCLDTLPNHQRRTMPSPAPQRQRGLIPAKSERSRSRSRGGRRAGRNPGTQQQPSSRRPPTPPPPPHGRRNRRGSSAAAENHDREEVLDLDITYDKSGFEIDQYLYYLRVGSLLKNV